MTAAALSASGVRVPDASAAAMFDAALAAGGQTPLTLRTRTWARPLPLARWCGRADQADAAVLDRYVADLPGDARVLDLGSVQLDEDAARRPEEVPDPAEQKQRITADAAVSVDSSGFRSALSVQVEPA